MTTLMDSLVLVLQGFDIRVFPRPVWSNTAPYKAYSRSHYAHNTAGSYVQGLLSHYLGVAAVAVYFKDTLRLLGPSEGGKAERYPAPVAEGGRIGHTTSSAGCLLRPSKQTRPSMRSDPLMKAVITPIFQHP